MIIPSIDLMGGQVVQLERGRELKLAAGAPRPLAERFGLIGEIAVIDLDAALGQGENAALIAELLPLARCRVGGGIRTVEAARHWLDAGAAKVILGTAARPEILRELPRERVIAAVDAHDGEVVVEGWRKPTGADVRSQLRELAPYVGGFLVTFVEREGTLTGTNLHLARELRQIAGECTLTVAGGVRSVGEIAALDQLGIDAQIGMALYTGAFDCAAALAALLNSDRPDGLWPTVVTDETGRALGLTYSNLESLRTALDERRGVYYSRKRGVWRKGESSGATQELRRVDLDCDRDALRFTVRQRAPGFCHRQTWTCWGAVGGLAGLEQRLAAIARDPEASPGSYTARLLADADLLAAKLCEEAAELAQARDREHVIAEAADVLYFTLTRLQTAGATLTDVETALDRRALRLTRRGGDRKPQGSQ